jgi:flagellar biosynthesis protein FliP
VPTRPRARIVVRVRTALALLWLAIVATSVVLTVPAASAAASAAAASAAPVASAALGTVAVPTVSLSGRTALVANTVPKPSAPASPTPPSAPDGSVTVSVPGDPSRVVQIIVLVTVMGIAPSILLMCTAFTKIIVVLSLSRSALGTQSVPPNQVLVGLALFLSLFVMGPTIDAMNSKGVQPYLNGAASLSEAYDGASAPLREFMLKHTRDEEIALMTKAAGAELPTDRTKVDMRTLVPAFVVSELRSAFIIGFVVFVPFLVVDIVVSAILMSMGMVMLPPSLISLPFKLLLFVLVDGWTLIVTTLLGTYR